MKRKIILVVSLLISSYHCHATDRDNIAESTMQTYVACKKFETPHLRLESISSVEQDISCYLAIYQDCGWRNSWFTDSSVYVYLDIYNKPERIELLLADGELDPIFESQHERIQAKDIENFKMSEKSGFYTQPNSFPNYIIFDKQTNELVGKFISCQHVKSGRIEKGIYILGDFRGKGYASEALTGIVKNVVDPALGKPFMVTKRSEAIPKIYPDFKGIYSKISPWYNYPSLNANSKAGCAIRWMDYSPITFYPAENESFLDPSNELQSFISIIRFAHIISKVPLESKEHMDRKRFFPFMKFFLKANAEVKDSLIDELCNLVDYGDESTAEFAQNALDVLAEETYSDDESGAEEG